MSNPINVLFVLPQLTPGGSERVVLNLVKGIDRSRFLPSIAWFHGKKLHPFSEIRDIPMFFINKKAGLDLRAMRTLSDIIRKENISIVNPNHFMPLFYSYFGCKFGHGKKLVYTHHSIWEVEQVFGIWKIVAKFLLHRSDAIVGVSPEVTRFLREKYKLPKDKIHTLKNGVDTNIFKPLNGGHDLRDSMGLTKEHIVIGMTGNFRQVKNHSLLIRAFAEVINKFPNCRLVIVGQGFPDDPENTEEAIRILVSQFKLESKVMFLGYRDDVHNILQCMDVFCLPSLREGLPLSLIEAMATGLPVVGTDVEGIRVVIDSGQNGFLVDPNSLPEFVEVLSRLVSDTSLRQRIGINARKDVIKDYSFDKFLESYTSLFNSLV